MNKKIIIYLAILLMLPIGFAESDENDPGTRTDYNWGTMSYDDFSDAQIITHLNNGNIPPSRYGDIDWSKVTRFDGVQVNKIPDNKWDEVKQQYIIGEKVKEIPPKHFNPGQIREIELENAIAEQIQKKLQEISNLNLDLVKFNPDEISKVFDNEYSVNLDISDAKTVKFDPISGKLTSNFPSYKPADYPKSEYKQIIKDGKVIILPLKDGVEQLDNQIEVTGGDQCSFERNGKGGIDAEVTQNQDVTITGQNTGTMTLEDGTTLMVKSDSDGKVTIEADGDMQGYQTKVYKVIDYNLDGEASTTNSIAYLFYTQGFGEDNFDARKANYEAHIGPGYMGYGWQNDLLLDAIQNKKIELITHVWQNNFEVSGEAVFLTDKDGVGTYMDLVPNIVGKSTGPKVVIVKDGVEPDISWEAEGYMSYSYDEVTGKTSYFTIGAVYAEGDNVKISSKEKADYNELKDSYNLLMKIQQPDIDEATLKTLYDPELKTYKDASFFFHNIKNDNEDFAFGLLELDYEGLRYEGLTKSTQFLLVTDSENRLDSIRIDGAEDSSLNQDDSINPIAIVTKKTTRLSLLDEEVKGTNEIPIKVFKSGDDFTFDIDAKELLSGRGNAINLDQFEFMGIDNELAIFGGSILEADQPQSFFAMNSELGMVMVDKEGNTASVLPQLVIADYIGKKDTAIAFSQALNSFKQDYSPNGYAVGDIVNIEGGSGKILSIGKNGEIVLEIIQDGESIITTLQSDREIIGGVTTEIRANRLEIQNNKPFVVAQMLDEYEQQQADGSERGAEARLQKLYLNKNYDVPLEEFEFKVGQKLFIKGDPDRMIRPYTNEELGMIQLIEANIGRDPGYLEELKEVNEDAYNFYTQYKYSSDAFFDGEIVAIENGIYTVRKGTVDYSYTENQLKDLLSISYGLNLQDIGDSEPESMRFISKYSIGEQIIILGETKTISDINYNPLTKEISYELTDGQIIDQEIAIKEDWFGKFKQDYAFQTEALQEGSLELANQYLAEYDVDGALRFIQQAIDVGYDTKGGQRAEQIRGQVISGEAVERAFFMLNAQYKEELEWIQEDKSILQMPSDEIYEANTKLGVLWRATQTGVAGMSPMQIAKKFLSENWAESHATKYEPYFESLVMCQYLMQQEEITNLDQAVNIMHEALDNPVIRELYNLEGITTEHLDYLDEDPSIQAGLQSLGNPDYSERNKILNDMGEEYDKMGKDFKIMSTAFDISAQASNPFQWALYAGMGYGAGTVLKAYGATKVFTITNKIIDFYPSMIKGTSVPKAIARGATKMAIRDGVIEQGGSLIAFAATGNPDVYFMTQAFINSITGGADYSGVTAANIQKSLKRSGDIFDSGNVIISKGGKEVGGLFYYDGKINTKYLTKLGAEITEEGNTIIVKNGKYVTYLVKDGFEVDASGVVIPKQTFVNMMNAQEAYIATRQSVNLAMDAQNFQQKALYSQIMATGGCFVAGTKIKMYDGIEKNIEDIKVGDKVLSYDIQNNKLVDGQVLSTSIKKVSTLIIINDNIKTTPEHPFYVVNQNEYAEAKDLKIGDVLLTSNEEKIKVVNIKQKKGLVTVYNFDVNEGSFDNYFANGVLVHNNNVCQPQAELPLYFKKNMQVAETMNKNGLPVEFHTNGKISVINIPRKTSSAAVDSLKAIEKTAGNGEYGYITNYYFNKDLKMGFLQIRNSKRELISTLTTSWEIDDGGLQAISQGPTTVEWIKHTRNDVIENSKVLADIGFGRDNLDANMMDKVSYLINRRKANQVGGISPNVQKKIFNELGFAQNKNRFTDLTTEELRMARNHLVVEVNDAAVLLREQGTFGYFITTELPNTGFNTEGINWYYVFSSPTP